MEKNKKCSSHKENEAILFCQQCKIYMCNKCEKFHTEILKNHHLIKLDKESIDLFTGKCSIENHQTDLKFFCVTHNQLCCAECITKIKDDEIGQHSDCKVCYIKDIENEKKNKLKENLKILENLSVNIEELIKELKDIYEKNEKLKEELKNKIQSIFTKIRNALNDREDQLLLDIDNKFNNIYFGQRFFRENEKLPNKIKISLEKGKEIDNKWKENELNSLINDCLIIERNIKEINKINENINKSKELKFEIVFSPNDSEINLFLENIKSFGTIKDKSIKIFDSKIEFDQQLVKTWLNNKLFKAELLFRKTRDGSAIKDFHSRCDNKGNTIIFIETTKGYKFGGYTELQWDNKSGGKTDESTFIFSFNHKEKYTSRNNSCSIYCGSDRGPKFGHSNYPEITFSNNLNKGTSYNDKTNKFIEKQKLTNGESNWDVKELEVYKINYI